MLGWESKFTKALLHFLSSLQAYRELQTEGAKEVNLYTLFGLVL